MRMAHCTTQAQHPKRTGAIRHYFGRLALHQHVECPLDYDCSYCYSCCAMQWAEQSSEVGLEATQVAGDPSCCARARILMQRRHVQNRQTCPPCLAR